MVIPRCPIPEWDIIRQALCKQASKQAGSNNVGCLHRSSKLPSKHLHMCRDGEDERLAGILKGAGMDSPSQASPSGSQSSEDEAAAVKDEPGEGDEDDDDDDDDEDDDGEDVDLDALHGAVKVHTNLKQIEYAKVLAVRCNLNSKVGKLHHCYLVHGPSRNEEHTCHARGSSQCQRCQELMPKV